MNPENRIHLFRSASRSWSKYQTTDPNWTLCGIRRTKQVGEKIGVPHRRRLPGILPLLPPTDGF
jgi:hypothetical protein